MFSGRENQLIKLSDMLVKVSSGEGLVALIEGEAGAGKTALINQFLELAKAGSSNLVIATSTCVAITGEGDAFHPFRQILRQIFSINEKRTNNRFLEFVSSIAPAWFSVIPVIGSLIGAVIQTGVEARKLGTKDSVQSSREEIFSQFLQIIKKIAEEQIIILVIDDFQWADASSASLLFYLAQNITTLRVLIFCSYRLSDIDQGSDNRRALQSVINEMLRYQLGEKVSIERLTEDETIEFVNKKFVDNQFPPEFHKILHQRSGGNILFLTSLLENLVTQGKLSNSNGGWFVVGQLKDMEIPDSLENILKQRINNLPAELHNFCELASVEGVDFTYEVVGELLQREFQQTEIQIGKQAQLLQQTFRIIVMREEKAISPTQKLLAYSFAHGLLQETFYNNLPIRLKEIYHFFIGELLELLYSTALDEIVSQLALHFLRGKQPKRAAKYFYQAAANNRLLSAITEADFNLSNAIQLLEAMTGNDADQGLLADCCQMLGHVRGTAIGQFDNGISLYQRALDIRKNLSNQGEYLVDCLHMMGVCYSASNRYIDARKHFTRALQLLRRLEKGERTIFDTNRQSPMGNPIGLLKERRGNILRDIGHTYQNEGNLDKAIAFSKQSLRLLENGRDDGGFSDTLYFLGLAHLGNKDYERAKGLFSQALEIRKKDKLFAHQVMIYRSMSDLAFSESKDNEGFDFAIRVRDLCKEYEFHFRAAEVLRFLANKYLDRHRFTEAFQSLAEAAMFPYFSNFDEYKETLNTIIDQMENFQKTGRTQLAIYFCEILIEHARLYRSRPGIIEFANKWIQVKEFLETSKPGKTLRDYIVLSPSPE